MSRQLFQKMTEDAWRAGLRIFIILVILEVAQRGFVSRFFNLSWIVLFLFVLSLVLLSLGTPSGKSSKRTFFVVQLIGVVAAAVVWAALPDSLRPFWREAAAGGILLAAFLSVPLLKKE